MPEVLIFDFLENEKSFSSEIKNIFPSFTSAFFSTQKQTSKNVVVDTTFTETNWLIFPLKSS